MKYRFYLLKTKRNQISPSNIETGREISDKAPSRILSGRNIPNHA